MPAHEILIGVIAVAIVLFAIARQVMPQRVRRVRFIILPIIGLYEAYHNLPGTTIPFRDIVECAVVILAAFVAGCIQALSVRVYYEGGTLYTKGGWITLVAWFGLAVTRTLIGLAFQGSSYLTSFSSHEWILWIGVAVVFGTRSAILYLRHPEIRSSLSEERANRDRRRRA